MTEVSLEGTDELMRHDDVDLILATGGSGLVGAAYSSGKPAFGVGPGNAPAYVDRSADLPAAARAIVSSQTFDNGTICASEQSLVLDLPIRSAFLQAMQDEGAYVCNPSEADMLGRICMSGRGMNPEIVGRYAHEIAKMAGFSVPKETTVLLAHCDSVGPQAPLSIEKLAPVLAVFTEDGWEAGCHRCIELLEYGGMGHTLAIHCTDDTIIHEFALKKPVNRILVNSPSAQGAVGLTTNLFPSMTLGCGSFGGNVTSDNIGPQHLLNIKRLAYLKQGEAPVSTQGTSVDCASDAEMGQNEPILWKPHPSPKGQDKAALNETFTSDELQDIIDRALRSGADGDCPFGKCAECPPTGSDCGSGVEGAVSRELRTHTSR
jgi:acyl-CoA reductase-like NAD-dependent aldehyde dehydrogenase